MTIGISASGVIYQSFGEGIFIITYTLIVSWYIEKAKSYKNAVIFTIAMMLAFHILSFFLADP